MKITVKHQSDGKTECSECHWTGTIEDANWMHESEFGYCPKCGTSEFEFVKEENGELEFFGETYKMTGWKARLLVYGLIAVAIVIFAIPWVWGVIDILYGLFNR